LCENGAHALALNFPQDDFFEYCCDCQSFWPSSLAQGEFVKDACPVCERKTARRFVCGDCNVVSIESDTSARRKQYSIPLAGAVTPSCPGCLKEQSAPVQEHTCEVILAHYATTRSECPFCGETTIPPPAFPSTVADYLRRVKAVKIRVRFDPKAGKLIRARDGELVLIPSGYSSPLPIVLPFQARFSTKRDYYAGYDLCFDCGIPAAGEIVVVYPAVARRVPDGWELTNMGLLEVIEEEGSESGTSGTEEETASGAHNLPVPHETPATTHAESVQAKVEELAKEPEAPSQHPEEPESHSPTQGDRPDAENDSSEKSVPAVGAASAAAFSCPACQSPVVPGHDTCPACGKSLRERESPAVGGSGIQAVAAVNDDEDNSVKDGKIDGDRKRRRAVHIMLTTIALIVATSVLILLSGQQSVENKLQEAINKKNLVTPEGRSALDYYRQLKAQERAAGTLEPYNIQLLTLLKGRPQELFDDYYQTGSASASLTQWEEAHKMLNWASEIRADDVSLAARTSFCLGYIAYLKGDKEQSLGSWRRANDLDTEWALPANAVGVIYNEHHDYVKARIYLLEAVKRDGAWAVPYNNLGISFYHGSKDYDVANNYFRQARKRAPRWAEPHYWLGEIAMNEGHYAEARQEFGSALAETAVGRDKLDVGQIKKKLARLSNLKTFH
jgi:tetratricopeptide (TPR) repeat protein